MINPAMFGISPQQLEVAKEVGKHLRMQVIRHSREPHLEIKYILVDPNESFDPRQGITQLAEQLMSYHDVFFGMEGEIIDVD